MPDWTKNTAITADGVYQFFLEGSKAMWVRVQIGRKPDSLGGATVTIEQDGVIPDGLSAVTTRTQKVVCMSPSKGSITVTGSSSPSFHVDFLEVGN